jgi:hypothetical protein
VRHTTTDLGGYAARIDLLLILGLFILFSLPAIIGLTLMAWRIWRHNEEMVPGGSLGRQLFGRGEDHAGRQPASARREPVRRRP